IKNFVDHGETVESSPDSQKLFAAYKAVREKGRHIQVKAGDKVPIKGLDWTIVSAGGDLISSALPGAGQANPYCAGFQERKPDPSENARSVGSFIALGKFRA